jgi:hypothetical protein
MKTCFLYSIIFFCSLIVLGQTNQNYTKNPSVDFEGKTGIVAYLVPYQNDSIAMLYLPDCKVSGERIFKRKSERKKYDILVKRVRKTYPFAKLAGSLLKSYNDTLEMMGGGEVLQKKYMKKVEQQLKKKFGPELENLTMSEGAILIKLIDRETGTTSYELVKEMRGVFSAVFWQTLAKVFGQNLKNAYDASGEDKYIEEIIQNIENGAYD